MILSGPGIYFGTYTFTYIGFSTTSSLIVSFGEILERSFALFFSISISASSLNFSPSSLLMIFSCYLQEISRLLI